MVRPGCLLSPLLWMCLVGVASADDIARLHRYQVDIDAPRTRIAVRACFAGALPRYLMAESLDASGALRNARIEGVRRKLEPNGTQLPLKSELSDTCLQYEVDLSRMEARHERGGNLTGTVGEDVLLDMGLWFWRPENIGPDEDILVSFTLPEGLNVSVPWRPDASGAPNTFRVGRTPYDWPALMAVGPFRESVLDVGDAHLRLVILGAGPRIPVDRIRAWVENAIRGILTVYGRFPVSHARVIVVPNAQGNEPIPWAFVQRGGGPSAQFFINHRLSDTEFIADWTMFHELSHLLLPYVVSQDAWLSEGLASYYQNVLRARLGIIDALSAWQRMHAGFVRGRKSQIGTTLADATERMYRNAGFMRVYWQGAALVTLADYRVRVRTNGRHSLDTALAGIARCCMGTDQPWRARALLARMDEITGTRVFTELHDQQIASAEFPDLNEVYEGLGFEVRDKELQFIEGAPRQALRLEIMRPFDTPPAGDPQ